MAPIDLGIDFDTAQEEARPPLVPDGTYEFQVVAIDDRDKLGQEMRTRNGQLMWNWRLLIINRPDLPNRSLFYRTMLPTRNPVTGEIDMTGIGFLVNMVDGINKRWVGTQLPNKETFLGSIGVMKVGHAPRRKLNPDDDDVIDNTVKIVTKKQTGGIVA